MRPRRDARSHYDDGLRLRGAGLIRDAAVAFARALAFYPPHPPAAYELGQTHELLGELLEAREAYLEAYRLDPSDRRSVLCAARISGEVGDWRDALAAYAVARDLDPADEEVQAAMRGAREQARQRFGPEATTPAPWPPPPPAVLPTGTSGTSPRPSARCGPAHRAIAAFRKMVADDPDRAVARLGLAATLRAAGRLDEAAARFRDATSRVQDVAALISESAMQSMPPAAAPHFEAGRDFLSDGRYSEAVRALKKATTTDPHQADSCYLLALALVGDGRLDDAHGALRQALEIAPNHLPAARDQAAILRGTGAMREAVAAYDAALRIAPEDVSVLVGRADVLRQLDDAPGALAAFDAVLAIDDEHLSALTGRAAVLGRLGRTRDALVAWEAAARCDPNDPAISDAADRCRQLLALEPAEARADPHRGQAAERARDELDRGRSFLKDANYKSAIQCFSTALELSPDLAEAAFYLGLALEDDRQFRQAIHAYRRCLALRPEHVQAATNIGECHRKNERFAEAIAAFDQALAIRDDYLYALAGRAESMRMLGRYEDALPWFDRALEKSDQHSFALQGKAAALNALGRFAEAMELWKRAVSIDPRSKFASEGKTYCAVRLALTGEDSEQPEVEVVEAEAEPEEESSSTPTLDALCRDLSALARAGELDDVIGRKVEIRSVMKTLVRRRKANPILLGDPGVGKTAVVEGAAAALASPSAPPRLRALRILELSMGSMLAGTKYRGTFEERMRAVIDEVRAHPDIVLFIDEVHTLVGTGRTEGGSLDASNLLKPALARGELRIIGATTVREFRKYIEPDAALERRFHPIELAEPNLAETLTLLEAVAPRYEQHHRVEIAPSALREAVRLAARYMPERRFPDKALDLLDEACADASLEGEPRPVNRQTVARVVSERTGLGVGELTMAERTRLDGLRAVLNEQVIGQEQAVDTLVAAVRRARAGLRAQDRPSGVFLFAGPSGVGKTQLAKALSEALYPEGQALIRLDMSEYGDRFTGSRLLGAPPGYAGHGEEGQLTGQLRRRPYSIVLLDELEKAHADIQSIFLSLFDDGTVEDAEGRAIDARQAMFIITTNAGGSGGHGRVGFAASEDPAEAALLALRPHFKPELLNRVDAVVRFQSLGEDTLRDIARLHLRKLATRAVAHGIQLSWTFAVPAAAAATSDRGARPVLRAIEDKVATPLSEVVLESGGAPRKVHLRVEGGDICLDVRVTSTIEKQDPPAALTPA